MPYGITINKMARKLEITPKIGCPNNCEYCPQDVLIRAYSGNTMMSLEQFKTALNNVPTDVQIEFTGLIEPFMNLESSAMMAYSIDGGYSTIVYSSLAGFTEKDALILKGKKFVDVKFHKFKSPTFNEIEFNKKIELFKKYIPITKVDIVTVEPQWTFSRAGNLYDKPAIKGKFKCSPCGDTFSHNELLPNGDVYLCCMDFGLKHKLGNLFDTRYDDLNRQQIVDLSNQEDSDIICRKCELFRLIK